MLNHIYVYFFKKEQEKKGQFRSGPALSFKPHQPYPTSTHQGSAALLLAPPRLPLQDLVFF